MAEAGKRLAAVLGFPVAHSLSPRLHNYWLHENHILDAHYGRLEVKPEALPQVIHSLADQGYIGVNLTLPHKEMVLPLLDEIDPAAEKIGAVNTIVIKHGKLRGMNTDVYGFMQNIHANTTLVRKDKAVVLGAGGAARAVCYALLKDGFKRIVIANRTQDKALQLAKDFGAHFSVVDWDAREAALEDADLLVNSTSLGMKGKERLEISLRHLPKHAVINDLVYAPLVTDLLVQASAHGCVAVDGLGMLIYQAVPAFTAWFGVEPQVNRHLWAMLMEDK